MEGYVQQADDVTAGLQTEAVGFYIRSFKQTDRASVSQVFHRVTDREEAETLRSVLTLSHHSVQNLLELEG